MNESRLAHYSGSFNVPAKRRGAGVAWRSIRDDHVSYAYAGLVIEDSELYIAVYQPTGAPLRRRTGRRGGPRNAMLPNGWDGGYQDSTWTGKPNVRAHLIGTCVSVIRPWDPNSASFQGWYVNLELPWRRSDCGYDSRDLILDITVTDDLENWQWKDVDQLEWSVDVGLLTAADAHWIWDQGWDAVGRLTQRESIFSKDWAGWAPDERWRAPVMPAGWNSTEPAG